MPVEQSGLLAEAVKLMGEPSCEPLVGDVTVTTGVVANATLLNTPSPTPSIRVRANCGHFIGREPRKRMSAEGIKRRE
jgi:hypothetical protein